VVLVGPEHRLETDDYRVSVTPDRKAVQIPRGVPLGVGAVGLIPGVMLGALKAVVLLDPFDRRVLVMARKGPASVVANQSTRLTTEVRTSRDHADSVAKSGSVAKLETLWIFARNR